MRGFLAGRRLVVASVLAVVAVGILGGWAIGQTGLIAPPAAQPGPSASPSPVASPTPAVNAVMDELHGDCTACHVNPNGGVGTKPIPALAHPLQGWTDCTGCHNPAGLVQTAPGHTGIHKDQCLICHKSDTAAAPPRPHAGEDVGNCLDCHGKTAPLPASMDGRSVATCWLCHQSSKVATPDIPHPLTGNTICETCHTAGKVGALPASHAGRSDTTCIACHNQAPTTAPLAPHSLVGLDGKCDLCHGPGVGSPAPLPSASALPAPGWSGAPGSPVPSPSGPLGGVNSDEALPASAQVTAGIRWRLVVPGVTGGT